MKKTWDELTAEQRAACIAEQVAWYAEDHAEESAEEHFQDLDEEEQCAVFEKWSKKGRVQA